MAANVTGGTVTLGCATCHCIAWVGLNIAHWLYAVSYAKVQISAVDVDLWIEEVEVGQRNIVCYGYETACVACDDLKGPS